MSLIVAARFHTFDSAQNAASTLMNEGVAPGALHTFFVNPAGAHDRYAVGGDQAADPNSQGAQFAAVAGAAAVGIVGALLGGVVAFTFATSFLIVVAGAGAGAYIGSLVGAMYVLGQSRPNRSLQEAVDAKLHEGRSSGVLLAVHTAPEHEERIARILKNAGGLEVERAHGRWADGGWEDFDPLIGPELEKGI
ncbi:MAG TPA: hypothetical protein VIR76_05205 [Pusillimonas sp.]